MPGVPSYTGCDACHKQKKKCDGASPACARCARLKIPCIGKGQLRYKFKEQLPTTKTGPRTQLARRQAVFQMYTPSSSPENEITALSNRFVSVMQVTEPKYDISSLGTWFDEVPARLGTNKLFDASIDAFVAAVQDLRSGHQTVRALTKYGKALTCLTTTLKDADKAKGAYTLAAIFMLMTTQSWVSNSADYINHMEGITHLLNASAGENWKGKFEDSMRFSLAVPAYVEAALNPNIYIDPWYAKRYAVPFGPYLPLDKERGQPLTTIDIPQLVRYPALFREPELHRKELKTQYDQMLVEVPFLLRRYNRISELNKTTEPPRLDLIRAVTQVRMAYAVLLCYALMINGFLSAMDPLDILLQDQAIQFAKDAICVAHVSKDDLPIGAGFIPATLFSAWAATDDAGVLDGIKGAMEHYKLHWAEWHYVRRFHDMKVRFREIRDRKLAELRANGHVGLDVTDFTTADGFSYDWRENWEEKAIVE